MQIQSGGHRYRVRFGVTFSHGMQYIKHHREETGLEEEQEMWEWRPRQAAVQLVDGGTQRCDGSGVFFALAAASVLVLLLVCRGRRWC
jgi:hypothetical protein